MPFDLSQKQSDAWHYLEDNETTEIVYGGGAGGGKSYMGCIWHVTRRMKYPGTRGLIGRAKLSALKDSTLITLFKVCNEMGYKPGIHYKYNAQDHALNWENGSKTILKDLFLYPSDPDFISLGSTEYTDVFIDEATEVTLKAFDILNSRVRWMLEDYNLIPKTLLTCNPNQGWLKNRYVVDEKTNERVILKPYQKFVVSLLKDNPDKKFKELYHQQLDKMTSDYDKRRLLEGDWDALPDVLNPFANQYIKTKHESIEAVKIEGRQVLMKIDFNLNPFAMNFSHMFRDDKGEHYHTFDEASIEKGSIPAMIDLIKARYERDLPNCVITGDSMGKRGDLSQRDNAHYYLQLQRGLGLRDNQFRLPNNPTHENSRADVNYVLYHFPNYKINPKTCPGTCADMRTVQCDAFGEILKRNRNDLTQRADFLDCERYGVNTFLHEWIVRHKKK
jgi:hypothetical protein